MLFMVEMEVNIPDSADPAVVQKKLADEKARAQELQKSGVWRHLWRVAGQYANVSVFDVESPVALHDIMLSLPLFPYMKTKVTALCRHPSSIHDDDR
ncbi:muconolactone Delta-isomerase [Kordiimonas pumila]|uniref:Muconolactone Delta-isomerase n=1 Tax=Kordiimonas pumila TaxID=2161677 RepID=A0ABV7D4Y3_9PROT|nr:muconolactone Delta-isomerase [Kordiimonas pumila]